MSDKDKEIIKICEQCIENISRMCYGNIDHKSRLKSIRKTIKDYRVMRSTIK